MASSVVDTDMEDGGIEEDPLDSYALVRRPLSQYSETMIKLFADYQDALQRSAVAAQTQQRGGEPVRENGETDNVPMDNNSEESGSSHDNAEYLDIESEGDSHAGSSSSPVRRSSRRSATRPSTSAITRLTVEENRTNSDSSDEGSDRDDNSDEGSDSNSNSDDEGSRGVDNRADMAVDGEANEQELKAAIGMTARRMVEFGIAGIDRQTETRYGIDMETHEVNVGWLETNSDKVLYKMDFDSLIGRCDCIPWLGSFQVFPLFRNGFPIVHSLHIGVNPLLGGYKTSEEGFDRTFVRPEEFHIPQL